MPELTSSAPVDSTPLVSVPRALLDRLITTRASVAEHRIVLLTRTGKADAAISEDAFATDSMVLDAGKVDGTPIAMPDWPFPALEQAVAHGTILRFVVESQAGSRNWLLLNTVENARLVARMAEDPGAVPEMFWIDESRPHVHVDKPTVFRLYEQNIGPLTPLIADQISRVIEEYPDDWIEDALSEAVAYNRRSWRYVTRILENWKQQGRQDQDG